MRTPSSMGLDGETADLDLEQVILGVQLPRRNLVRGEPSHLCRGGERVAVRLDDDVGRLKELAKQGADAQPRPSAVLGPGGVDHGRSRHREEQRSAGGEETMKLLRE